MEGRALLDAARQDLARGWSVRAATRLRQAVDAGIEEALEELARALLSGRIPGGAREARQHLEGASSRRNSVNLLLRASLRYAGIGGPMDRAGALHDLGAAAHDGSSQAAIELALVWHELDRPGLAPARAWLDHAGRVSPLARELSGLLPRGESAGGSLPVPDRWPDARALPQCERLETEPRIERYRQVLDPLEAVWLCSAAKEALAPSLVADPRSGAARPDPVRTGRTMCFGPEKPGIFARRLADRLARLTGCGVERAEPLAVIHYRPGEQYRPHYDWLGPALDRDPLRSAGERVATVLAWLNKPDEGGATLFPRLDLRVEPAAGDALAFANLDAAGIPAEKALHAGEPIKAGEKWLVSLWIRQRPVQY
ncbi:MAG: 2OG-Fe(II) oxygenase [Gammaproteobacteria bacterium]|nr:2OG-Fe(II) oxygenase [Gammaproteobacteria bacterium]